MPLFFPLLLNVFVFFLSIKSYFCYVVIKNWLPLKNWLPFVIWICALKVNVLHFLYTHLPSTATCWMYAILTISGSVNTHHDITLQSGSRHTNSKSVCTRKKKFDREIAHHHLETLALNILQGTQYNQRTVTLHLSLIEAALPLPVKCSLNKLLHQRWTWWNSHVTHHALGSYWPFHTAVLPKTDCHRKVVEPYLCLWQRRVLPGLVDSVRPDAVLV